MFFLSFLAWASTLYPGRNERREQGRQPGRKEGRKEGGKEGRKEARKEGLLIMFHQLSSIFINLDIVSSYSCSF